MQSVTGRPTISRQPNGKANESQKQGLNTSSAIGRPTSRPEGRQPDLSHRPSPRISNELHIYSALVLEDF
jgi:hypothetical protein